MRIAMIGTGYVGLVSGACFADFGHQVCCIDKDSAKIDGLHAGKMPIWEPGLEAIVKVNAERGRLTFTTSLPEGVKDAEAVFIAVGTPARRGDGHADLTFVFEAVRELARVIRPGTVVVTNPSAALLAAALSVDDYVITSFNAGQTLTFPLFIFGATRQGVPPEVNVLASGLLFVVLILLALNVVVQRARGRRDARVAAVPATVGAPANA